MLFPIFSPTSLTGSSRESIADFIEGRSAKTVGARSYLAKLELAKQHYRRYARYLDELRTKARLTAKNIRSQMGTAGYHP